MELQKFDYNGITNCYEEIEITPSWAKIRRKDRCPLCTKKIATGEMAYIMINNCKLFPNTIVHKTCVDELGMEEGVKHIKDSWDTENAHRKQIKVWR